LEEKGERKRKGRKKEERSCYVNTLEEVGDTMQEG